MIFDVIILFDW